jgi:hypothetical protein
LGLFDGFISTTLRIFGADVIAAFANKNNNVGIYLQQQGLSYLSAYRYHLTIGCSIYPTDLVWYMPTLLEDTNFLSNPGTKRNMTFRAINCVDPLSKVVNTCI